MIGMTIITSGHHYLAMLQLTSNKKLLIKSFFAILVTLFLLITIVNCNIKFYAFYTKLSPIKKSAGIIPSINNLISINLSDTFCAIDFLNPALALLGQGLKKSPIGQKLDFANHPYLCKGL
jgi:hypothetical protein